MTIHTYLLAYCIGLGVIVSTACAESFPESQRIGTVFDSVAINYFKLLPRSHPRHIQFLAHPSSDSVAVQVKRSGLQDTAFAIPHSTAKALAAYIDHFEEVFAGTYTPEWNSIRAYISPVRPFVDREPVIIKTVNNTHIDGYLLVANNSLVIVCTGRFPSSYQTFSAHIIAIPVDNLASIDGRVINGNPIVYARVLPWLNSRQVLLTPSPECVALMHSTVVGSLIADVAGAQQIMNDYYLRRWHVMPYIGLSKSNAPLDLSYASIGKREEQYRVVPREFGVYPYVGIACSYSFTSTVHGFLLVSTFPYLLTEDAIYGSLPTRKDMWGRTYAAGAAYSLLAANPQLGAPVDLQFGLGIAYTTVSVQTSLFNSGNGKRIADLGIESGSRISPIFSLMLQYFVSQTLSIDIRSELIPSTDIPIRGQRYTYGDINLLPVKLVGKSFEVGASTQRFNIGAGIGIHL